MLRITIPAFEREDFDEEKGEFVYTSLKKEQTLTLEHSLVSLSKWESKWCKPFLDKKDKTNEETLDYIRCMIVTPNVDPDIVNYLTAENIEEIHKYIAAPMTATTINDKQMGGGNGEIMTAELLYYYMFAFTIPIECQKWHLNRLITLIRIFNIKNSPGKKMSKGEIMSRNAALNAKRRAQLKTKG